MSFSSMSRSVGRNIKRYGTEVTLRVRHKTGINLDDGLPVYDTQDHTLTAILGRFRSSEIVEGVINFDDVKCTLQFSGLIKKEDVVIFGGRTLTIINTTELIRGGKIVKHTLQLRI